MRPRVLICLPTVELGGNGINAVDLAGKMRDFGFEPYLAGFRAERAGLLDVAERRNLAIEVLPRAATSLGRARDLTALYKRVKPDLVHVYAGYDARAGFWGPARLGRVPLVLTVYEMRLPPNFYRRPGLVVGTRYLLEELSQRPGTAVLISPPVDTAMDRPGACEGGDFDVLQGNPEKVCLVMVTRVTEDMKARHIEAAIGSLKHLPDRPNLVIVGSGDAMDRFTRLAASTNAELGREAVLMTGELADPRPAYAVADIVLGMGSSAARGLSFGKPLVVIGEYGMPELFDRESSASIFRRSFWNETVPSGGSATVADVLAPLIENPQTRAQLGSFGREFAEENFSLDQMAERLAEVYRVMLHGGTWRTAWLRDSALDLTNLPRLAWKHASGRLLGVR